MAALGNPMEWEERATPMSEAFQIEPMVTIEEFDAFLNGQPDSTQWELVAGRIVARSNPNERHEQIASNLGAPLKLAMDTQECRTYLGGMGVQLTESRTGENRLRPDVVVRCGPVGDRNFVTDPIVVAEVLSPSTMDYDRGEKLVFYKQLPTLRHIVLIYQDRMCVEHFQRIDDEWSWETLTQPDDELVLEAVGFTIALNRVYFAIDLSNVHRISHRGWN